MSAVKPVKPALTWEEVSQQLKNPRVNHKLDSDDINRLRIRAAFQKRKEKRLKGKNKGRNLQDHSERQVEATNYPARRSKPSPVPSSEKVADRKDALQFKDNEVPHRRKSVEGKKSKMASGEENDAGSLLPSLDDGSRSAEGSSDVDTILNSNRQNNGRLPSIDENQLVARNKKFQEEKFFINSSDPTNMEAENSPDHHKRSENISKKISSAGAATNSDRHEEKSRIESIDTTNMENTNYPDHGKRNENGSNRRSSLPTSSYYRPNDKDETTEWKSLNKSSESGLTEEDKTSQDHRKGKENSSNKKRSSPRTLFNDDKDEEKEDKSAVENTNSPDHHKRKGNTSNNQSSLEAPPSNRDKDGDKDKHANENPQKNKTKRPQENIKKTSEAPSAEKQKGDNRTEHEDEANQSDEAETEIQQVHKKEPKKKKKKPLAKDAAASKPSYVDDELDEVVVKLERMVNRTLRALQGMKADDADDELDDLDQKTINRFIDGDRYQEIDAFLNS